MPDDLWVTRPTTIGVATYPPGATYGPRRLGDHEFVWVIEGEVEYRSDGRLVAAPPGSLILCQPGSVDFFRFDPGRRTRHAYFHFRVVSVPTAWPPAPSWPIMRACADDDLMEALFRHLLTWAAEGAAAQVERTTAHLLVTFVDGQSATNRIPADVAPPAVGRALSHIYARLDREPEAAIRLDDLAAVAGVNRAHLCRIFRATTGRTPLETVRLARLDRAATLLARSNYTVAEIAAACGFASPFHFSRRFKESYGEAPRTLRDRLRAGAVPPEPRLLRVTSAQ